MKVFLILILGSGLAAAAHFTRPSEASFKSVVKQQLTEEASHNFFKRLGLGLRIHGYLDDCEFKDRYLWVDVERKGKTVYTGAFGHWFDLSGKSLPASVQAALR